MEITLLQLILAFGVPGALTGLVVWWFQRKVQANEKKAQERESNLEDLILMMTQTTRANTVGITAIARAVQRIPDAHCNGDMTAALDEIAKIQEKEKAFLMDKGLKYIFE